MFRRGPRSALLLLCGVLSFVQRLLASGHGNAGGALVGIANACGRSRRRVALFRLAKKRELRPNQEGGGSRSALMHVQRGLDEAFGFAVGLRGVRLNLDVLDSELAKIVSHDAFHGDTEASEVGDGGDQERDGT
jgi:hypothetical protein